MAGRAARRQGEEVLLRLLGDRRHRARIVGARHVVVDQQHQRRLARLGDRPEVGLRIVGTGRHDGLAQHEQARIEQDRVAVGIGAPHRLGAHGARGAADILDDDLLAELVRQPLGGDAAQPVGAAARRIGHDHLQRLVGIGPLTESRAEGRRREQRGARGAQNRPSSDHGWTDTDDAHSLPPAASQIVRTTRRALTSPQATPRAIDVSRCCFKVAFPPGAIG